MRADFIHDDGLEGFDQGRLLGFSADLQRRGRGLSKALPQLRHALVEREGHESRDQHEDGVDGVVAGVELAEDDLALGQLEAGGDEPNEQEQHGRDGDELGQVLGRAHPFADDARRDQVTIGDVADGRDQVARTRAPGAQIGTGLAVVAQPDVDVALEAVLEAPLGPDHFLAGKRRLGRGQGAGHAAGGALVALLDGFATGRLHVLDELQIGLDTLLVCHGAFPPNSL